MAEDALKVRRSAKTSFTRKKNDFFQAIAEDKDTEILRTKFRELTEAWSIVEGKHDIYLMYLSEEEIETSEKWINELQDEYNRASAVYTKHENEIKSTEQKEKEELNRQHMIKLREEEFQRIVQQTIVKKKSAEAIFEALIEHVENVIETRADNENAGATLRKTERDIELALADCKRAHDKMLEILNEASTENEIEWIRTIQTRYNETIEKIQTLTTTTESKNNAKQNCALRMEKVKMPSFDGTIREYPQFKQDFQRQVMPTLDKDSACYILRSCLAREPTDAIKGVEDDIQEMWKRLDEKYGDPAKVADAIIDTIQSVRPIKEGENKRFVEFVDTVENGHKDLKRLGLEREITTTSSVSIIERKLPAEIKKEWAKLVSADNSTVDKTNKFPSLLNFLLSQKRAIEYETAQLRFTRDPAIKGSAHYTGTNKDANEASGYTRPQNSKCLFHKEADHWTNECKLYLSKPTEERMKMLKEKGACWSCLRRGHRVLECWRKRPCGVKECTKWHHKTLHQDEKRPEDASGSASLCNNSIIDSCLLQLQKIPTKRGWANVLWDSGASLCFITNSKAKAERLKGTKIELTVIKVGGDNEKISSNRYTLSLIDKRGQEVQFEVYGIDKITSEIQSVNIDGVIKLFKNIPREDILRPSGAVDVLIGYEYAAYHPQNEQSSGHLLLLKNRFGRCIGGTHPSIKETTTSHNLGHARINTMIAKVEDFYKIENLGIECTPRCGGCKCGKCSLGSKDFTIKEEKELKLIETKLEYNKDEKTWITEYPWIKDPSQLPNNKKAAMGMLISTEKRLAKNEKHAEVYQKQIEDMIEREVARKLSHTELENYKGPIHYISHHEVLKPDSKSTPVRIVFNSSARYMNHSLNDYWAKGPHLLNDLLGILIRFRENRIALIGDIKKMYHTVKTKTIEQQTHRFLWRDMNTETQPDTYVIQRVSFGDKPSGAIATVALRKTAEMGQDKYPKAAHVIKENTYMDDIIESVSDKEKAKKLAKDIENLLEEGSFKIKEWIFTNDGTDQTKTLTLPNDASTATEKVLGVVWNPMQDEFEYKVQLKIAAKKNKKTHVQSDTQDQRFLDNTNTTKRIILSQVNSIYDPLGLAGPFTIRAKILMRQLWGIEEKLHWDDPIPDKYKREWMQFCQDLIEMNNVKFKRCLKPKNATGEPIY